VGGVGSAAGRGKLRHGGFELSNSGAASPQSIQVALDEIRTEEKLDVSPDPSKAFEWSFVQK
jgi:hypothetical protein